MRPENTPLLSSGRGFNSPHLHDPLSQEFAKAQERCSWAFVVQFDRGGPLVPRRMSEVQEIPEPHPNAEEALVADSTSDGCQPLSRERARLLCHDPRRPVKTARAIDSDVIRPASIYGRDRQDNREGRHGVQVTRGCDDQHGAMSALLSAANRLKRRPCHDAWRELEISHARGR